MLKKISYLLTVFLGAIWILISPACVSLTADSYMPLSAERFPAKPKNVVIPILEHRPQRPYMVIGKMAYETSESINFIYKSLQYNARKHGADAVIMHSLTSRRREWVESQGPSVESRGPWVEKCTEAGLIENCDGSVTAGLIDRPKYHPGYTIQHPGYTIQREQTLRSVQAEAIVYK